MSTTILSLTCPNCGAQLRITDDIERFACRYCGKESIVQRGGDVVSLAPVIHELRGVRTGVDRTASELAIVRLREEIPKLEQQLRARQKLAKDSYGTGVSALAIVVYIAALVLLVWLTSNIVILIPAFIVLTGFTLLCIQVGKDRTSFMQELATFEQRVNDKKAELQHHESLVSMPHSS